MPTPLLILSDHPAAGTGLARITRDLALSIHHHMPEFRVATLGHGSPGTYSLPFQQYQWRERADFHVPELPSVWNDFAGQEKGVILTAWDSGRLLWLADGNYSLDQALGNWVKQARGKRFSLWGYFPFDAIGIGGKFSLQTAHILKNYDRVLCYTKWAAAIAGVTIDSAGVDHLPHGIDTSVFHPRDRKGARTRFGRRVAHQTVWPQPGKKFVSGSIPDDAVAIGIVATNQARKDFGLGIQSVAEIAARRKVFLWIHTDALKREWSILELLSDFGLIDNATVTIGHIEDDVMAWCYSAMDVTLGIGRGEGFGYPIQESMACGTPCVHGDYGGGQEYLPKEMLVPAAIYRVEGPWNLIRPVFEPHLWAEKIMQWSEARASLHPSLDWTNLWPRWQEWLKGGL